MLSPGWPAASVSTGPITGTANRMKAPTVCTSIVAARALAQRGTFYPPAFVSGRFVFSHRRRFAAGHRPASSKAHQHGLRNPCASHAGATPEPMSEAAFLGLQKWHHAANVRRLGAGVAQR